MPKTKKQTKKAVPRKVIKRLDVKQKLSDDQVRIQLLKTEVHYFKGLAIMMVVLIFCVFVAFGCLFSAMYMEVRATRVVFQDALSDFLPQEIDQSISLSEEDDDFVEMEDIGASVFSDKAKWLVFEKYNTKVYFPNSWTYLDKPFQKQVHFYADGEVKDDNTKKSGDIVLSIVDKDNFINEDVEKQMVAVAGMVGVQYQLESAQVVLVSMGEEYVQIRFNIGIEDTVHDGFLDYLELVK